MEFEEGEEVRFEVVGAEEGEEFVGCQFGDVAGGGAGCGGLVGTARVDESVEGGGYEGGDFVEAVLVVGLEHFWREKGLVKVLPPLMHRCMHECD